jgi:hypothetical protein
MDAESTPDRLFTVAFVPGVTLAKWSKVWAERRPDLPLGFAPTQEEDQVRVLHAGTAEVSFVRLPIDDDGLSVIPLYRETPVAGGIRLGRGSCRGTPAAGAGVRA